VTNTQQKLITAIKLLSEVVSELVISDIDECEHEPEMNVALDERPRYMKARHPKCCKCGEFYEWKTTKKEKT
jgi:hypothetical protein